jgi:tetratricopeptide (TPR) repeat protein
MEEYLNVTPPINFSEGGNDEAPKMLSSSDITHLLQGGVAASKLGEKELAQKLFLKVTSLEPDNETAWLWLASISEQAQERLEYLKKVLAANPANERALSWVKLTKEHIAKTLAQRGADAIKENDKATAVQFLLQAVDFAPENEMAWVSLASIADSPEDKLAYLQRILNINPANDQVREQFDTTKEQLAREIARKGIEAVKTGDLQLASDILQDALDYDPDVEEVWLLQEYVFDAFEEEAAAISKSSAELGDDDSDSVSEAPSSITESLVSETADTFSETAIPELPSVVSESMVSETAESEVLDMEPEALGLVTESVVSEDTISNDAVSETTYTILDDMVSETTYTSSDDMVSETPSVVSNVVPSEIPNAVLTTTTTETVEVKENAESSDAQAKEEAETQAPWVCPVCQTDAQTAFDICPACQSMLTLDDIDMLLANEYVNEGLIHEGIKKLKRSFKFDIHAEDYYKLGLAYLNLKDLKESIAFFQASHRLDYENYDLAARIEYLIQRRDGITQPQQTFSPTMPFVVTEEAQTAISAPPAVVKETVVYEAGVDDNSFFAETSEMHEELDAEKMTTQPLMPIEEVEARYAPTMPDVSRETFVYDYAETSPTVLIERKDLPDLSQRQAVEEYAESNSLHVEELQTETTQEEAVSAFSFEEDTSSVHDEVIQLGTADLTEAFEQTESHGWPLPEFEETVTQPVAFANTQAQTMEATAVQAFSEDVYGEVVEAASEEASFVEPMEADVEASELSLSSHEEGDVLTDFFFSDEEEKVEVPEQKMYAEKV